MRVSGIPAAGTVAASAVVLFAKGLSAERTLRELERLHPDRRPTRDSVNSYRSGYRGLIEALRNATPKK